MDWGNVTVEDLVEALREVDWSIPPRPPSEFFSKFTPPRSFPKWTSRLNAISISSYRANYFVLFIFILGIAFLMRPLALLAAALAALSVAFLNDSFAATLSEKITRTVKQFSPHLAAKMRPPHMPVIRGRPSAKKAVYICGLPRWTFVSVFLAVGVVLWFLSGALVIVSWALLIAILVIILHSSLRMPNLKARLNTFREEFRSVWRNYSEL